MPFRAKARLKYWAGSLPHAEAWGNKGLCYHKYSFDQAHELPRAGVIKGLGFRAGL